MAIRRTVAKGAKASMVLMFALRRALGERVWRRVDPASPHVVLVYADLPRRPDQYLYSDSFAADLALIRAVCEVRGSARVVFGRQRVAALRDQDIFFNLSYRLDPSRSADTNAGIVQFVRGLEAHGNRVHPSVDEILWWENKAFMHRRFDELGIPTPRTWILDLADPLVPADAPTPILLKEIHSAGARGIEFFDDLESLQARLRQPDLRQRGSSVLLQELCSVDRDLRVVLVADEIVYAHWRFKHHFRWEASTYAKGKQGLFEDVPERWRSTITQWFSRTGLVTGAFDLAWPDQDLSRPPMVFEVSPRYFPNPAPPPDVGLEYGDYKHRLRLRGSFESRLIDRMDDIHVRIQREYARLDGAGDPTA